MWMDNAIARIVEREVATFSAETSPLLGCFSGSGDRPGPGYTGSGCRSSSISAHGSVPWARRSGTLFSVKS